VTRAIGACTRAWGDYVINTMKLLHLKTLLALAVVTATGVGCVVERRVERPRGCRHGEYIETRHGGYWRCEAPHRHHAHEVIIR
jgi:hypothetical protein